MKGNGVQLLRELLREKSIVIRERTPVEIILYSVFLYLSGLSFRKVSSTIEPFIKRSRTFVWVYKFGDMHLWFRFVIDLESGKAGQKLSAVWVITAFYERGVDIKNESRDLLWHCRRRSAMLKLTASRNLFISSDKVDNRVYKNCNKSLHHNLKTCFSDQEGREIFFRMTCSREDI